MAFIGNTNTTQAFTPAIDYFSGTGSATAFTLSRPVASVAQVQVTIDNVAQNPSSAYTISCSTITFTSAPLSGTNNIYVYYTSPITQVIAPGQGTVTSASFGAITTFTTSGNTILGDASTDTLNVGNGGLVKDASGNVGIGNTSPSRKFEVTGSGDVYSLVETTGTTGTVGYLFGDSTSDAVGRIEYIHSADLMTFTTASTERMRIDSSGNLLVGTTSLSALERLSVVKANTGGVGVAFFSNTNNSSGDQVLRSALGANANNTSSYHFVGNTGTDKIYIFGNGNIQNVNNSYGALSDLKLKENIIDATPKLEKLNQVRIVNFNMIGDGQKQIGVIAQELEQIFPSMVDESPDRDAEGNDLGTTTKSVKYSVFVPMLIKAIQEQQALITSLTARITALESR